MMEFHFLGAPRLESHDAKGVTRQLVLDTRKAVALAAYLALTQTAHERDELAAFLYPDADGAHARAALRRTLSSLKTALVENVLDIERESIALSRDHVRVDVLEFRSLVRQNTFDSLTRAAELYRGDFLAGFTLRDSPAFDEWQFFETETLRKQLASALEQLVGQLIAQPKSRRDANKPAIEYARRWLALDPLHEPAHRALMLLYARDGQRAAALRQYRECVRQLETELGVAPLPETTALYHAIQENKLPAAEHQGRLEDEQKAEQLSSGVAEQLPHRPTDYPFIGRVRELEILTAGYSQIMPGGCLLVIQGEAGIGKTRLAEEFLAVVAKRGAAILSARGYVEQRALAYAPFVQALQGALRETWLADRLATLTPAVRADAARLVPELTASSSPDISVRGLRNPSLKWEDRSSPADGLGAQARFLDAMTQVILKLANNGMSARPHAPGVLFLDDAQWLDEASLDLLAFLIRRLHSAPLCILLAWRTEEVPSDHALRRLYADELRQERARLISLSRLGEADVQALVQVATQRGAPIDSALAERLSRESEGQPFFLTEALKQIEREGQLPNGDALPASVRELLHSRLARTSETARQLLSAAAVLGHSFDFEMLDEVSGRSEQETLVGVEELAAQGLIVEMAQAGAPKFDFTHEKIRALIYEETSLARRRLLHRRTAEVLTQQARGNPDAAAGTIALHHRAGGDDARAAEYYKRAGDYARSVFANRDAIESYSAALALGFPEAGALHKSIGDAETLLGNYDAALTAYEASAAFGAKDAEANIARVALRRGEWERATQHLQNALVTADHSAAQAQLYADLALALHHSHRDADALKQAQHALKLAKRAGAQETDERALAGAYNILGILARTRGDWTAARKYLEASRVLAEKMKDVGAHAAALNNLALVAHATQEDARALELAQRALELVTRSGDRHRQAALYDHLADLYHALGRDAESMQQLKQAVAIYAEIGGPVGAWQPEIWKLKEW